MTQLLPEQQTSAQRRPFPTALVFALIAALAVSAAVMMLAVAAANRTWPWSPLSAAAPAAPELSAQCAPANRLASVSGDIAYDLTLTNPGSSPVQVSQVAVIFTGASGMELGSDDPAQQDFPGDAYPIRPFNAVLIGAGQSVTVPMETSRTSGGAGGWTCSLGSWSQ